MTYPTTIDQLGNWNRPCCHLVAEYAGQRFYIDTFDNIQQGEKSANAFAAKYAGKRASFYLLDRSATHVVSDGPKAFGKLMESDK